MPGRRGAFLAVGPHRPPCFGSNSESNFVLIRRVAAAPTGAILLTEATVTAAPAALLVVVKDRPPGLSVDDVRVGRIAQVDREVLAGAELDLAVVLDGDVDVRRGLAGLERQRPRGGFEV